MQLLSLLLVSLALALSSSAFPGLGKNRYPASVEVSPAIAATPATAAIAPTVTHLSSSSSGDCGENLAAGTGKTYYNIADDVSGCKSKISAYDYNKHDISSATGYFTQVAWKSTTQVASAVASCPAGTMIFSQVSPYVVWLRSTWKLHWPVHRECREPCLAS